MKELFDTILQDVRTGKNVDAYIAVLLSFTLAVLSLVNKLPAELLGAALLGSLGWLILNAISRRRENEKRINKLLDILVKQRSDIRAKDFFVENYVYNDEEFQESFRSAQELYVIGMGQNRSVTTHGGQIHRILTEGGKVHFILADPDGVSTEMAMKRGSARQSLYLARQSHWSAVARLASLFKDPDCKGKLEVKFIDLLAPYTMYGFDIYEPDKAKIYVWITPFREPSETRPGFKLTALKDPDWFIYFRRQYEKFWNCEETKTCNLDTLTVNNSP